MELFDLLEDYLIDQDDGLRKLLIWFYNLVMQLEAIQQCGAEPYERSNGRTAQRNGHKKRSLKTRVGELCQWRCKIVHLWRDKIDHLS